MTLLQLWEKIRAYKRLAQDTLVQQAPQKNCNCHTYIAVSYSKKTKNK